MNNKSGFFKHLLNKDDDAVRFYSELDKHSKPIRTCAKEIVKFLQGLRTKSKPVHTLSQKYHKFESIDIKNIDSGIENIFESILEMDLKDLKNNKNGLNEQEILELIHKQNEFNSATNNFVKHAIEIAQINA